MPVPDRLRLRRGRRVRLLLCASAVISMVAAIAYGTYRKEPEVLRRTEIAIPTGIMYDPHAVELHDHVYQRLFDRGWRFPEEMDIEPEHDDQYYWKVRDGSSGRYWIGISVRGPAMGQIWVTTTVHYRRRNFGERLYSAFYDPGREMNNQLNRAVELTAELSEEWAADERGRYRTVLSSDETVAAAEVRR